MMRNSVEKAGIFFFFFWSSGCLRDVPFAQPCAVCLWVMEAPCMCQSGWFGLELGTGDGWGVGTDTSALTRDCPKPTVLIRIKPIISLSVFAPCISLHWPPFLPPFFLSHPRICSLPLSCCSFSCSCLTLPSQPYNLTPKKKTTKKKKRCSELAGPLPRCHFFSTRALDLFWMITRSRF